MKEWLNIRQANLITASLLQAFSEKEKENESGVGGGRGAAFLQRAAFH